jgi:integral membrane protein (TIGR00529 family)
VIEFLLNVPAYVKVGVSFAGILLINRLGASLGLAILLFSVVLSLWSGTGIPGLVFQVKSFGIPENFLLPVVIFLLLFFTESLNKAGRMERTVVALKSWLNNKKMLLAGLPALVGLLPMPGGAIFSAPLVASIDGSGELGAEQKVAINYWFRHIWEYWWPLYPGVILAIRYSELPTATFLLIQFPFTFAAAIGGYFFILKKVKRGSFGNSENGKLEPAAFLSALGPIAILVFISVLGSAVLPKIGLSGTLSSLLSMLIGLIIAIAAVFCGNRSAWIPSLNMLKKTDTWQMVILVISILAFSATIKAPLEAAGTTLVTIMRDEFINAGIPLIAVIMLIPFISGLGTGLPFGAVSASFPVVFALLGQNPTLGVTAATTALAFSFGFMGAMLSPIHVCFVVTCAYFKTPLFENYRYIIGPIVVVLIASLILSGLYYTLM